jgi:hypothetical protein
MSAGISVRRLLKEGIGGGADAWAAGWALATTGARSRNTARVMLTGAKAAMPHSAESSMNTR